MIIYKYQLNELPGRQQLSLRRNAKILSIQQQYASVFMWVLEDPSLDIEYRNFTVFYTGEPIPSIYKGKHLATVQLYSKLVIHIFEDIE